MAWLVAASLLPALGWGIALFGVDAARVCAVAVLSAAAAELLSTLPFGRFTLSDGSAALTGLLIGMFMPAGVPLVVPAAASVFAIIVVKQTFGGLGRNWMNPAMGGVIFALLSWGSATSRWVTLGSGAAVPPLDALRASLAGGASGPPLAVLNAAGYPFSGVDGAVVGWIDTHILAFLDIGLRRGSFDVVSGLVVGPIGAVSVPLLLAGAAFLLARGIIRWEIPAAFIGVFALLVLVVGGPAAGGAWLTGGTLFHVLSGTLLLGAFFAATDPVTSPLSWRGRWIYGAALGALTFLLRFFGTLGDGVAVSIVLCNALVPLIDLSTLRRASPARGRASP